MFTILRERIAKIASHVPHDVTSLHVWLTVFPVRRTTPLEESTTRRMTYPEMQMLIRQEGGEEGLPVDCCPTIEEMVEPQGGRNRDDMFVELYRGGENKQRFFEYSCRPDVLDKPCRFIDRKLQAQSRCVQKFTYTYAIVQNPGTKVSFASSPFATSDYRALKRLELFQGIKHCIPSCRQFFSFDRIVHSTI